MKGAAAVENGRNNGQIQHSEQEAPREAAVAKLTGGDLI